MYPLIFLKNRLFPISPQETTAFAFPQMIFFLFLPENDFFLFPPRRQLFLITPTQQLLYFFTPHNIFFNLIMAYFISDATMVFFYFFLDQTGYFCLPQTTAFIICPQITALLLLPQKIVAYTLFSNFLPDKGGFHFFAEYGCFLFTQIPLYLFSPIQRCFFFPDHDSILLLKKQRTVICFFRKRLFLISPQTTVQFISSQTLVQFISPSSRQEISFLMLFARNQDLIHFKIPN